MTEAEKQAIASRFRTFRKVHTKLLQKDLADEAGQNRKTINFIENARVLPNREIVSFLTQKYGLNPQWLTTGKGEEVIKARTNPANQANILTRMALLESEVKDLKQTLTALLAKLDSM